jgi:hypothetical protein
MEKLNLKGCKKELTKLICGGIALLTIAAVTVVNVNVSLSTQSNTMLAVPLANIKASTALSGEWWDSKVYDCKSATCSVTYLVWTYYGSYEQCLSGSTVAHCWNCASCDA